MADWKNRHRKPGDTNGVATTIGFIMIMAILFLIIGAVVANAHSGRLDGQGGHWDRSSASGGYHHHEYRQCTKTPCKFVIPHGRTQVEIEIVIPDAPPETAPEPAARAVPEKCEPHFAKYVDLYDTGWWRAAAEAADRGIQCLYDTETIR